MFFFFFFFSSRRRHTRLVSDWSSDVCSSDLVVDDFVGLLALLGLLTLAERLLAVGAPQVEVRFRALLVRSEERRVGKECRYRWGREDLRKKMEVVVDRGCQVKRGEDHGRSGS